MRVNVLFIRQTPVIDYRGGKVWINQLFGASKNKPFKWVVYLILCWGWRKQKNIALLLTVNLLKRLFLQKMIIYIYNILRAVATLKAAPNLKSWLEELFIRFNSEAWNDSVGLKLIEPIKQVVYCFSTDANKQKSVQVFKIPQFTSQS